MAEAPFETAMASKPSWFRISLHQARLVSSGYFSRQSWGICCRARSRLAWSPNLWFFEGRSTFGSKHRMLRDEFSADPASPGMTETGADIASETGGPQWPTISKVFESQSWWTTAFEQGEMTEPRKALARNTLATTDKATKHRLRAVHLIAGEITVIAASPRSFDGSNLC